MSNDEEDAVGEIVFVQMSKDRAKERYSDERLRDHQDIEAKELFNEPFADLTTEQKNEINALASITKIREDISDLKLPSDHLVLTGTYIISLPDTDKKYYVSNEQLFFGVTLEEVQAQKEMAYESAKALAGITEDRGALEDVIAYLGGVRSGRIVLLDKNGKPLTALQDMLKNDSVFAAVQEKIVDRLRYFETLDPKDQAYEMSLLLGAEESRMASGLKDIITKIHKGTPKERALDQIWDRFNAGLISADDRDDIVRAINRTSKEWPTSRQEEQYTAFFAEEDNDLGTVIDEQIAESNAINAVSTYKEALDIYVEEAGRPGRLTTKDFLEMWSKFDTDISKRKTEGVNDALAEALANLYMDVREKERERLETEFNAAYKADFLDAVLSEMIGDKDFGIPAAEGWRLIRLGALYKDLGRAQKAEFDKFLIHHDSVMGAIETGVYGEGAVLGEEPLELSPANYLVMNARQMWRDASPRSDIPTLSGDIDNWTEVETDKFFKDMKARLTEEAVIYDTMIDAADAFRTRSKDSDNYTDDEMDLYLQAAIAAEKAAVTAVEGYRTDEKFGWKTRATGLEYLDTEGVAAFKALLPPSAQDVMGLEGFSRAVTNIEDANSAAAHKKRLNAFIARVRGGTIANLGSQHYSNYKDDPEKYKVFGTGYYSDSQLKGFYDDSVKRGQTPDQIIITALDEEHAEIEFKLESDFEAFNEFYEENYINNISQLILDEEDLDERERLKAMKAEILTSHSDVWRAFHKAVELDDSLTPTDWFAGEGKNTAQVLLGNDPGILVTFVADLQVLLQDQETEREKAAKDTLTAEAAEKAFNEFYEESYLNPLLKDINDLTAPADTDERNRLIDMYNAIGEAQSGMWGMFKEASDLEFDESGEGITPENWFAGAGYDQGQVLQGAVVDKVVPGVADIQLLTGGQSITAQAELEATMKEEAAKAAAEIHETARLQEAGLIPFGTTETGEAVSYQHIKGVAQPVETAEALEERRNLLGISPQGLSPQSSMAATSLGLGPNAVIPGSTFKESGGGLKYFEDTPFFQGLTDEEKEFARTKFTEGQGSLADQESVEETINMASEITNKMVEFRTEQTAIKDRRTQISQNLGPLPGALDDPAGGQREAFIRTFDESGEEAAIATLGPDKGGLSTGAQESMKANLKAAKLRAVEQLGPRPEPKPTTKPTTPVITGERRGGPTIRRIRRP
jgi:hypothetical protein